MHPRLSILSDQQEIRRQLANGAGRHYVYVLCYPDGCPFYVGKGVGSRVFFHEGEARNLPTLSHKLNVIRALVRKGHPVGYVIDSFHPDEKAALARERELIQIYGRHDCKKGPLTNQTNGGEGTSEPSLESRMRRAATLGGEADDPERRAINEFFNSLGQRQDSVPIKPLGSRRLVPLTPHPSPRAPSSRMAQTLLAAAIASGVPLKPDCLIPRCFKMKGVDYVIENGVGRDMLKAGVVQLLPRARAPELEILRLTHAGYHYIVSSCGYDHLLDLGAIEPTIE